MPVNLLASRWRDHGDRAAREALFARFLPLARKLAARYVSSHEPLEDLVQVASVGLLGAVDRYDPGRGMSFTGFAVPTILGELKRHFRNTGWSVHVPRGAQEMALRIDRATRQFTAEHGRPPRVDELTQLLEVSRDEVLEGLEAGSAHYSVSLDAAVPGPEDQQPETVADSVGGDDAGYEVVETRAWLAAGMEILPELERRALTLRLAGDMKQVEIAQELGCSQMQVSRLLRRAATRLRESSDPDGSAAPGE